MVIEVSWGMINDPWHVVKPLPELQQSAVTGWQKKDKHAFLASFTSNCEQEAMGGFRKEVLLGDVEEQIQNPQNPALLNVLRGSSTKCHVTLAWVLVCAGDTGNQFIKTQELRNAGAFLDGFTFD